MKRARALTFVLIVAAGFASCSQSIGVPPSLPVTAQDFFWQPAQLTHGMNYYVVRNGAGSNHLLLSLDGNHIEDGALSNQVTMVAYASADSVVVDSIGLNSIFSLPKGYLLGPDSSRPVTFVRDTTVYITTVYDTMTHDSVVTNRDTVVDTVARDTVAGRLLLLLRTELDSGHSWHAGTLYGPGIPNGMPITATVLDHLDSLYIPPARAGADSAFGETFKIRYAPQNFSDSLNTFPIYWIAYYSRNVGLVLIQQYSNGMVAQSAQLIGQGP